MNTIIVIDTETTGVESAGSRMVELAAIELDSAGNKASQFNVLVNPGMPIPADATKLHGITDEMVKDCVNAEEAIRQFLAWLPGTVMVAHNAKFDVGILNFEAAMCRMPMPQGLTVIDTCEIAKAVKATKNNKLSTLAEHYGLVPEGELHRALADADLCRQLFNRYRTDAFPFRTIPWNEIGLDYKYPETLYPTILGLPDIIKRGGEFTFSYSDADGDITTRTIVPYGYAETDKGQMFHGLCKLRDARRTFRADRIIENNLVAA